MENINIAIVSNSDFILSNLKGVTIATDMEKIDAKQTDVVVMASYSRIIDVHQYPGLVFLNVHNSLLPQYRGMHAFTWAMINGEKRTGFTLHHVTNKVDAGNIIAQLEIDIYDADDINSLFDRAWKAFFPWLGSQLDVLKTKGIPEGIIQDESGASYFRRRTPDDNEINWDQSAERVYNFIRALSPPYTPGAFTRLFGEKLFIERSVIADVVGQYELPGLISVDGQEIIVNCRQGTIRLKKASVKGLSVSLLDRIEEHDSPQLI